MTKREIENQVITYAGKARYNSDMASKEVKDRINTAVRDVVALAMLLPNQGKEFRFGNNQKVIVILAAMKKDITAIITKRINVAKDVSKRLNRQFNITTSDWDSDDWIGSERYGKSYAQRLGVYTNRLKMELEAYIAVGAVKGFSQLEISNWFMSNIESPHTNNDILDAVGYASVRASSILTVGVGGIASAYKSIVRLNEDMLIQGYHISNNTTWGKLGMFKYVRTMGDSLVCARCEANVGLIFPAQEPVVQVHNHCRCYEVLIIP